MDKPGATAIKAGLSDGKSLSGSVPMDGVVNFDLGGHNEFMDLLDMVNSDSSADDNRAHFDFSSLGPLPDDFPGFDFDSDVADKWPALTTSVDSSYDFCKSPKSLQASRLGLAQAKASSSRKGRRA